MDEAEILDGAGEDQFVDEENDGLGGLFRRRPFNLVELGVPDFQIFEELLFEFGFFGGVFEPAESVEDAAGFAAARREGGGVGLWSGRAAVHLGSRLQNGRRKA